MSEGQRVRTPAAAPAKGLAQALRRALDRFLPPEHQGAETDIAWKSHLLLNSALVISALLLAMSAYSLITSSPGLFTAITLIGALASLSVPFVLRRAGPQVAGAIIPLVLLTMDGGIAHERFGALSMLVGWNTFIPVAAVFFVGPRFGLAVVGLVVAELLLFTETSLSTGRAGGPPLPPGVWLPESFQALFGWIMALLYERFRRRAQERAEAARQAAVQASNAKSAFLTSVSHEIRTPMNGVVGMTQLLLDTSLDGQQRRYALTIQSSAGALLEIVNDLLDFSRIEALGVQLVRSPFDLRGIVDGVGSLLEPLARTRDLTFAVEVGDIPPRMLGDAKRIRQVLVNLVGNAIKYTATGGVTVAVTSERRNPRVTNIRIAVTDTGPGIPEDRIESIFDKYSRIDDERGALAAGTGLGLPITRTLVNAMGGTISVRSELGRGSTFTVELPLTIALPTAKIRESEVIERDADRVRLERPLRVLVVDDVQTNLLVARGLLERIGCEVIPADDGVEALMRLDEQAIDLVFMDCLMPGLDGYETTRRIRAHARAEVRGLPVIALTAGVMAEERQRCLDAGMDDILAKPITPGALREVLTRNTRRPALAPAPGSSAEAS